MLDFTRSEMSHLIHHYVGNKGLGHTMELSLGEITFHDDDSKNQVVNFLTNNFKSDIVYEFSKKDPDSIYIPDVHNCARELFKKNNPEIFVNMSHSIANHLYNQTMHPKLPAGTMYMAYFKDILCDGEVVDGIGIFKKEVEEQFLKPEIKEGFAVIETENGQSIDKLEKGVLILNTAANDGFKIQLFDKGKKNNSCAFYWVQDFLGVRLKDTPYYQTSNQIMQALAFCEEILTTDNNVSLMDKKMVENKVINFFTAKEKFNIEEFKKEVLCQKELISSFNDHKLGYESVYDMMLKEDFDISKTAIKEKQKYASTMIHLDNNFEIKIKSRHDLMDQGYDEEKGLKYIKLWYSQDEFK